MAVNFVCWCAQVLNGLRNCRLFNSSLQLPVLKMIFNQLRSREWLLDEDEVVTETVLRFCLHVYHQSKLFHGRNPFSDDKQVETAEREYVFNMARKLGVSSLRIFSDNWQQFLDCEQLQQLVLMAAPMEETDHDKGATSPLAPELIQIIQEFYNSRLFHDKDSCLLLTKYLKSSNVLYGRVVASILENAECYHAEALFHLAQLQLAKKRSRREVMDSEVFAIVRKAFQNLNKYVPRNILQYVDWLFTVCTSSQRGPAKYPFYTEMIDLVCNSCTDPQILLHVLQRMESKKLLTKQSVDTKLGLALIRRYREHFPKRFSECSHTAYAAVLAEMQRARLECRRYVEDGEVVFDSEVVDLVRSSHSTKKKLLELLSINFPKSAGPESS